MTTQQISHEDKASRVSNLRCGWNCQAISVTSVTLYGPSLKRICCMKSRQSFSRLTRRHVRLRASHSRITLTKLPAFQKQLFCSLRNILQYFLTLEDYHDAVREGDGKRMAQVHKDFLLYFKTDSSFNAYSLEMMVNVALNEILLSEREAEHAIWGQTVNWKGGPGKNMEADLISILISIG